MSELINAVKEGNLELVKKLLKVDENTTSPFNYDEDYITIESMDSNGTYTCKKGIDTILITQEGLKYLLTNNIKGD